MPKGRIRFLDNIVKLKAERDEARQEIKDLNKKIIVMEGEYVEAWEIIRELRRKLSEYTENREEEIK